MMSFRSFISSTKALRMTPSLAPVAVPAVRGRCVTGSETMRVAQAAGAGEHLGRDQRPGGLELDAVEYLPLEELERAVHVARSGT